MPQVPEILQQDIEAAALADLVIQQHTQLKRVQLNLVTKAQVSEASCHICSHVRMPHHLTIDFESCQRLSCFLVLPHVTCLSVRLLN